MSIFISETGRSFPNIDSGNEYQKNWDRPSYGKYESYAHHSGPGTNYQITFNDEGPGTSIFGEDKVYYIGDQEQQCVGECDYERMPVYRYYRGSGDSSNRDHKYTNKEELRFPEDFPGESGNVSKGYNHEPRNGRPAFYIARSDKGSKTQPLYHHYENDRNDSVLSTNSSYGSGYVQVEQIGYIYTSQSNANDFADADESAVPLYEYYRGTSNAKRDHFYTADPTQEVNLQTGVSGVPDCKDPRDQDYSYVGIVGWVFTRDLGQGNRKNVRDQGLIGPVGYGSPVSYSTRAGWYNWNYDNSGIYTHANYEYQYDADAGPLNPDPVQRRGFRYYGTPSVHHHPDFGWGDPQKCPNTNTDAYFEWVYGKNGAVKAAVPKYLEFHTLFDSQFCYYIYDTSYPWKGPIFSIQYSLSNRNCCPNKSVSLSDGSGRNTCVCDENLITPTQEYHSHFYEVREDSWKTTNTRLEITDGSGGGIYESFKNVDTDTKRILFRYTTRDGDSFEAGDTINGWEINEVAYFGNKLRCGYMELRGSGDKFTTNQLITAPGRFGKSANVLAGYGVPDRAGFFGVYEFPKKITYYKVEIDKTALVNQQSIDEAKVECIVNKNGEIQSISIINGGRGYINPSIVIEEPAQLSAKGANDHARQQLEQLDGWEGTTLRSPTNKLDNPDGTKFNYNFKQIQRNQKAVSKDMKADFKERKSAVPYSDNNKDITISGTDVDEDESELATVFIEKEELRTMSSEHRRRSKFRQAKVEVVSLTADGAIDEILIKDRGLGYDTDPNRQPRVWIIQTEKEDYKMRGPNTKEQQARFKTTVDAESTTEETEYKSAEKIDGLKGEVRRKSGAKESNLKILDEGIMGSFETMMEGFSATYPTGYIKFSGTDDVESTKLCSNIPPGCTEIKIPNILEEALFPPSVVRGITGANQAFKSVMEEQYPQMVEGVQRTDEASTTLSHVFGWNNQDPCVMIPQPRFYNVTRLQDLPCPFTDSETGRDFGWVIYKYCGSKSDNAHFGVNLSVQGKTTGSQGADFMNFLQKLPRPALTKPRPVMNGGDKRKMWKCSRQNIEGRCYWDPSGGSDIIFIPVGLDENTFDWGHNNFSEAEQLGLWLGDNLNYNTRTVQWTIPATTVGGNGQPGDPDYSAGTSYSSLTQDQTFYVIEVDRLSGGVPPNECWDTYLRHGSNSDGVLDVYSAYYVSGSGNNQTQGKTTGSGYWGVNRLYNGYSCGFSTCTYTFQNFYGSGWSGTGNNQSCLEYCNDVSIAVDPQLFTQLGMRMGPYSGTMNIKNWSTGASIAYGQAVKGMGNPFFQECDGGAFGDLVDAINPNPPVKQRRVHLSSHDPGDKALLKRQKEAYKDLGDVEFSGELTYEYDADFDYDAEISDNAISNFSTDTNNMFPE